METLQLLPVCFLLLTSLSRDVQTNLAKINCDEHIIAEIGKDITITCRNNAKIINTTVKFCANRTVCPNSSDINTFKKIYTTDKGRITLKININSVTLHITSIQISDQRIYRFDLYCVNGFGKNDVRLEVVDNSVQVEDSLQMFSPAMGPETAVTERPILDVVKSEKAISEKVSYSTVILVPIAVIAFVAGVWCWRKRKGTVNLRWQSLLDAYHQSRFPEVSFQ